MWASDSPGVVRGCQLYGTDQGILSSGGVHVTAAQTVATQRDEIGQALGTWQGTSDKDTSSPLAWPEGCVGALSLTFEAGPLAQERITVLMWRYR